jgi:serine acetyltransferase
MGVKVISNVTICEETRIAAGTYVLTDIVSAGVYDGHHAQKTIDADVSFF